MKHFLILAVMLLSPVISAEIQQMTCEQAIAEVIKLESLGASGQVEYKNFLKQVHHSENEHSIRVDEELIATTTIYPGGKDQAAFQEYFIESIVELLPYIWSVFDKNLNDNVEISIPREYTMFASELFEYSTKTFFSPGKLSEGIVLSPDEAASIRQSIKEIIMRHVLEYRIFVARLVDAQDSPAIIFQWNEDCQVNNEYFALDSKVNGQNIRFAALCAESDLGLTSLTAIGVSREENEYLVSQFRDKMWVDLEISEYRDTELDKIRFWAKGFTRALNSITEAAM